MGLLEHLYYCPNEVTQDLVARRPLRATVPAKAAVFLHGQLRRHRAQVLLVPRSTLLRALLLRRAPPPHLFEQVVYPLVQVIHFRLLQARFHPLPALFWIPQFTAFLCSRQDVVPIVFSRHYRL